MYLHAIGIRLHVAGFSVEPICRIRKIGSTGDSPTHLFPTCPSGKHKYFVPNLDADDQSRLLLRVMRDLFAKKTAECRLGLTTGILTIRRTGTKSHKVVY